MVHQATMAHKKGRGEQQPEPVQQTLSLVPVDPMNEGTLEYWANRINSRVAKTVESIMAVGEELALAKANLKHGEWLRLLESGLLHVGTRTVQMFMAIARNQVLANTQNFAFLPPSPTSLTLLAEVDDAILQGAIDAREIIPALTIGQARSLVSRLCGKEKSRKNRHQRS